MAHHRQEARLGGIGRFRMFVGITQMPLHPAHTIDPQGAADHDYRQQNGDHGRCAQQQMPHLHLLDEQAAFRRLAVEFLAQGLIHALNGSHASRVIIIGLKTCPFVQGIERFVATPIGAQHISLKALLEQQVSLAHAFRHCPQPSQIKAGFGRACSIRVSPRQQTKLPDIQHIIGDTLGNVGVRQALPDRIIFLRLILNGGAQEFIPRLQVFNIIFFYIIGMQLLELFGHRHVIFVGCPQRQVIDHIQLLGKEGVLLR